MGPRDVGERAAHVDDPRIDQHVAGGIAVPDPGVGASVVDDRASVAARGDVIRIHVIHGRARLEEQSVGQRRRQRPVHVLDRKGSQPRRFGHDHRTGGEVAETLMIVFTVQRNLVTRRHLPRQARRAPPSILLEHHRPVEVGNVRPAVLRGVIEPSCHVAVGHLPLRGGEEPQAIRFHGTSKRGAGHPDGLRLAGTAQPTLSQVLRVVVGLETAVRKIPAQ